MSKYRQCSFWANALFAPAQSCRLQETNHFIVAGLGEIVVVLAGRLKIRVHAQRYDIIRHKGVSPGYRRMCLTPLFASKV